MRSPQIPPETLSRYGSAMVLQAAVQDLEAEISDCRTLHDERLPQIACRGEVPQTVDEVRKKVSRCLECLEYVWNARGQGRMSASEGYDVTEKTDAVLGACNRVIHIMHEAK